ncbi:MAG: ABC transporter permease, partial [Tannerella sp.]|nr:ABC transporter permease [Tannerella sp.]
MRFRELIKKNIAFYARYYRLMAAATLITVAVIVGSLVTGDSVRSSLVNLVRERLGDTESLIFSRNAFMDEALAKNPLFGEKARGLLLSKGFIAAEGKLIPVFVWGTDDLGIPEGSAKLNPALAKEAGLKASDPVVLRLPAAGLIPSGSLFVTDNYTTSLRLNCAGILPVAEGGNLSLQNNQSLPFNIFVNRKELCATLKTEGKINLILSGRKISEAQLDKAWTYRASGLSLHRDTDGRTVITSDRAFLQKEVTETLLKDNPGCDRHFAYLANSICFKNDSIPYSFVTAVDRYGNRMLQKNDILLSDYTAKRLHAGLGDTISMSYFTAKGLKTLETHRKTFVVRQIVPIREWADDKYLVPDFPGLSDVERCTDWNSDLPINMKLITDADEDYWTQYRTTPKAFVAYAALAPDWSNAYGNATSIRTNAASPSLGGLQPEMFGLQLVHPRESGLYAARNGVDFSSLFLSLGCFIIVAAILLMLVPLSEMLYRRRSEIALLQALGYGRKRIASLLWKEASPVVLLASVLGLAGGLLYTLLIVWLLGNVWVGATHASGFSLHPGLPMILAGFVLGGGLSLFFLHHSIRRSLKEKKGANRSKPFSLSKKKMTALVLSVVSLLAIGTNFFFLQSVTLFVIVGVLLLATAYFWGDYLVCAKGSYTEGLHAEKLVWGSLFARRKQAVLSFFALAGGVFIVFAVGLNRRGFSNPAELLSGTGGYSLWCESSIPVYYDMGTKAGRARLALTDLPAGTGILQCLRYGADDASCLNLNKVSSPSVLGMDMDSLQASDF